MKFEKYLPIGTVVMLANGTKRLMITGFCIVPNEGDNKMYDYCGCMYPEGIISTDEVALFNHDQIAQVYYVGYKDEEEEAFKTKLKATVAQGEKVE